MAARPKTHIPEEDWERMKNEIKFRKEDLDRLVMDFLVTEVCLSVCLSVRLIT